MRWAPPRGWSPAAIPLLALACTALAQDGAVPIERLASPLVVDPTEPAPPGAVTLNLLDERLAAAAVASAKGCILEQVPWAPGVARDLLLRRVTPDQAPQIEVMHSASPGLPFGADMPRAQAESALGVLLVGSVVGAPESRVLLSFGPAGTFGVLSAADGRYIISSGPFGLGYPLLAFDPSLVPPALLPMIEWTCDAPDPSKELREGGISSDAPCRQLRIAADSDHEFLELFQGDELAAANYAIVLAAAACEIFTAGTNARIGLTYLRLWATADDPWDGTTPWQQLVQFRAHWNLLMLTVSRDAAHFLSGRPLGGGTAWTATVCGSNAFSLSSNLIGFFPYPLVDHDPQNWDVVVVTHEIGHNLGAIHTHQHGIDSPDSCFYGDCTSAWGGTIMSYCFLCPGGIANLVLELAQVSIDDILNHLGAVACDYTWPLANPVAVTDWVALGTGSSVAIPVVDNDLPANCGSVTLLGYSPVSALGGVVTLGEADGVLIYAAPPLVVGIDSFEYTLVGEGLAVATGQVLVEIVPIGPDLDGDGRVNGSDLGSLIGAWGSSDPAADLDENGTVDGNDAGVLLGHWTG